MLLLSVGFSFLRCVARCFYSNTRGEGYVFVLSYCMLVRMFVSFFARLPGVSGIS